MTEKLTIGFVRRGFSSGGGAESYLQRLAAGVAQAGHQLRLYTSAEWPAEMWNFGPIVRLDATSATAFADELEKMRQDPPTPLGMTGQARECDVLMSLERVWRCDVYRAGDGVHRAWLERRNEVAGPLQKLSRLLNRKHSATLSLEESLFGKAGAGRVIANSRMVKEEIIRFYGFPGERIDVVYNGVPLELFRGAENRASLRSALGIASDEIVVLFAGSGWERKGLSYATIAVDAQDLNLKLLVAGRGDSEKFPALSAQFLGVVRDMPLL